MSDEQNLTHLFEEMGLTEEAFGPSVVSAQNDILKVVFATSLSEGIAHFAKALKVLEELDRREVSVPDAFRTTALAMRDVLDEAEHNVREGMGVDDEDDEEDD